MLGALETAPTSKADLARVLGQKSPSGPLHEAVRGLVTAALVEMTVPEKPNSRAQKYRLTEAGRARLAQLRASTAR